MNENSQSRSRPLEVLLLVPSPIEARLLLDIDRLNGDHPVTSPLLPTNVAVAPCGCGLATAGVMAARWITAIRPRRILLAGLGGSLDPRRAPIGALIAGTHVSLRGIGAGQGDDHLSLEDMGLQALPESDGPEIALSPGSTPLPRGRIVTVAAASASSHEARTVRAAHPESLIEDMETWSVALASRLGDTPLTVVRAVSNVAGVRDKSAWRIERAAQAFREAVDDVLRGIVSSPPRPE